MRKSTKIFGWILLILFSVVTLGVMGFGIVTQYVLPKEELAPLPGKDFGLRPETDRIDLPAIPDEADQAAMIEWCYNLYVKANSIWLNCDNLSMAVAFETSMDLSGTRTSVNGYQYYVKTPTEYYHTEYSFSRGGDSWLIDAIMSGIAKASTTYAARSYANSTSGVLYKQLTTSKSDPENVMDDPPAFEILEDGSMRYIAAWEGAEITEETVPQFYPSQPGYQDSDYEQTAQRILPETIKSAKASYNAELGYYEMELVLDTDNPKTTEITRKQLQASSGDDNANYSSMVETIQVWDNGYYRYFHSVDAWHAPAAYNMGIKLDSVLDYNTYYYYDEASIDPENYQNMIDYKTYLQTANLL